MTVEKTHQYRPGLFVVMSLGLTWFWWALAITLGGADEKVETYAFKTVTLAFSLIGLLAPTITAVSLIVRSRDRSLIADFLDRIVNVRRISPRYLIVTLLLPPAAMCLAIGLSLLVGESTDQFRLTVDTSQIGKLVTMVVLTMILAPILEEMGWRGYGVDSFRARMGMLKGTLAFGVLLSVWHAPLTLIPGSYHYGLAHMDSPIYLANFFIGAIPTTIIINWLYYKHDRSILATALVHTTLNASGVLLAATPTTDLIATGVFTAIALVIVVVDRRLFSEGPRTFIRQAAAEGGSKASGS